MANGDSQFRHGIDPARIGEVRAREAERYRKARPRTERMIGGGAPGYLGGVPMHWMLDWPMPFPILVDRARDATLTDIDGNTLDDFCLGDTGSMFGHSLKPVARAIRRQAKRGLTYMLPNEDAVAVGRQLQAMFGLPFWQIATTASDANRFALRVARAVTGRPKILVFNGCYHGAVEETFVRLQAMAGRSTVPAWPASSATIRKRRGSSNSTISMAWNANSAMATSPASSPSRC